MQAQLAAEAQKAGLTVPQYVERLKAQAMQQHQMRQQMAQQPGSQQQSQPGAQPGQQVPIQPGPPKPEAIAVAKFLQSQNLKSRTCIFQEKRKDMFKVKRAIRALHSEAYKKARAKNPLLPEVHDRVTAENVFKLLPLSMLALRVSKIDPHEGHNHGKKKRVKGLWTVKIEQQQEARDEYHYMWFYEGTQWKNKLYAGGALLLILAVVFFPVWPYHLRLGVWYLSMAMLGVLGLFFAMAIFRLILFLITMFTHPPGLWLFPNLFEDVGFFDSFKPGWAWHEDEKAIKKRKKEEKDRKKAKREAKANGTSVPEELAKEKSSSKAEKKKAKNDKEKADEPQVLEQVSTTTTGTEALPNGLQQRNLSARVEEVEDDE
jgi:translocation protein SEC62